MLRGQRITAVFEFSAPAFPGAEGPADGKQAEIRPTAIKAGVRLWWRALAWSRLGDDPVALKRGEDALFGAPARDKGGQRAGGVPSSGRG